MYRKRCKRFDKEGQAHCLTFSCFKRQPFFVNPVFCGQVLDALQLGRSKGQYELLGYVIMPEHVHIVLLPGPGNQISQILSTVKQSVSKKALLHVKQCSPAMLECMKDLRPNGDCHYRFWQRGGGYDRNLRSRDDIVEKIRYVHSNPVRRELVKSKSEWKWSSYNAWKTGEDEPIPIDRSVLF
jgi:putative transposase